MRYRIRIDLPLPVTYVVDSQHIDDILTDTSGKPLREAIIRAATTLNNEQLLSLLDHADPDVTPIDERADDDDRGAA